MLTRCPQCFAWFRVRAEQLSVANGLVTCGRCDHVFNALASLIDEQAAQQLPTPPRIEIPATPTHTQASAAAQALVEAPRPLKFVAVIATPSVSPPRAGAPATVMTAAAAHHVTVSPGRQTTASAASNAWQNKTTDLVSKNDPPSVDANALEIDLPPLEQAAGDLDIGPISTQPDDLDISDFDFSAVDDDVQDIADAENDSTDPKYHAQADEPAARISPLPLIIAHDNAPQASDPALVNEDITGPPPAPATPPILLDDLAALNAAPRPFAWRSVAWTLFGLTLTAVAALQVAFIERQPLLAQVPTAAWMIDHLCARVPCLERRQIASSVRLLARDVREHPSYRDALLVNATIVNDAKTPSPYPVIDLRLRDAAGNILSARQFQPAEYLDQSITPAAGMPSERPVYIVLELAGSASNAVSFEFTFL